MSFIDKVHIYAKAGTGGDGCLSFRREKYVEFGGPNGGDGGRGGSIYLVADSNMGTLMDFTHHPHLEARDGENGKGSNKTGAGAEDLRMRVPVGTVIYKNGVLLADLTRDGEEVLVARGGRGGRGNMSFKTHKNTAPRIAERGEPGENNELDLELKLIADVGLVGFPNAGKSSLLARVSNARPKVADYPFTTLTPHLGFVRHKEASFVMADIPGLIEGAHGGKGLGVEFLRHVERTRVLVHLVDPLGYGGRSALDGVRIIEAELKAFSKILASKPRVLVVTKLDISEGPEILKKLRSRFRVRKVLGVSSVTGAGVSSLLDFLLQELSHEAKAEAARPAWAANGKSADTEIAHVRSGFEISREGFGRFRVAGPRIERIASMTNANQPEAVERFQRNMKKLGVDRSLKKAGIREGDLVRIGRMEFEWSDLEAPPRKYFQKRLSRMPLMGRTP